MTKSTTAAYNANEVAAVYMSLNRNDLLSSDEGGSKLSSDITLKNGLAGLSDPLNSRGLLESFEADFTRGKNSSSYKIRILNPTTELEDKLIGFYASVFPSTESTFEKFKEASDRDARMKSVSRATGDQDIAFLANNEPPALPRIYLRFGYGTNSESGLSRIHKAVISDLKYMVSNDKDKVIELKCVDLYTFSRDNPSFNKRPFISRVSAGDLSNGQKSLRRPSEILTELIGNYVAGYPDCIPIINLGAYTDPLNNLVYSVAYGLAESDKLTKEKKKAEAATAEEAGEEEPTDTSSVPVISAGNLSTEQIKMIEDMLDRPLVSDTAIDRGVKGVVTQQVLVQAYKLVFEQLGLNWELAGVDDPKAVKGPPAQNQVTTENIPKDKTYADITAAEVSESQQTIRTEQLTNIQSELLRPQVLSRYTRLQDRGTNMLGFWPMALDTPPTAAAADIPGLLLGTIRNITTVGGKQLTLPWAPLAPLDCANLVPPLGTTPPPTSYAGGCGTGYPQMPPPNISLTTYGASQLSFGTVIEFVEDAATIRRNAKPITRVPYKNTEARKATMPSPPFPTATATSDVHSEFDNDTQMYHKPQWYSPGESEPTLQSNDPIKIKIMNVQGAVELNEREFWLYQPDSTDDNSSSYFLYEGEEPPDINGMTSIPWLNEEMNNELLSPYEQGGEIWLADAPLQPTLAPPESKSIRPLTPLEKVTVLNKGVAPLLMDAGMVNAENYTVGSYNNYDKSLKYSFTLGQLNAKFDVAQLAHARLNFSLVTPIEVSVPVITTTNALPGYRGTYLFTGPLNSANETTIPYNVPLLDLTTMELFSAAQYDKLPAGEFKEYAKYASGVIFSANQIPNGFDASKVNAMADNPPLVYLEPTTNTGYWTTQIAANYDKLIGETQALSEEETTVSPEPPPLAEGEVLEETTRTRPKWAEKVAEFSNAYVSMGDPAASPHISTFLEKIINNINRLIIGRDSKLMVQPIQVNSLSEEDKRVLTKTAPALQQYNWDGNSQDNVFLVIGPSAEIQSEYGDPLVRPILSFPQTTDLSLAEGDPDKEQSYSKVMWLEYGTPNSIVAKLDFTGDMRILVQLAQSNYTARQWNDVKQLFDGDQTLSKNIITNVISAGLANKIAILTVAHETGTVTASESAEMARLVKAQNKLINTTKGADGTYAEGTSDALIDRELLEMFPELIQSFQTDEDLVAICGLNSSKDMRVLASLISNPGTLNWLFPESRIDGSSNKIKTQVISVTKEGVVKNDVEVKILQRKIDFDDVWSRINNNKLLDKMSDVKFNFQKAIQEEAFTLNLTLLGIPEIDNPAQEFLSRVIFLKFYDSRLANGQLHWLSGAYRMTGFKHKINPSQGFLTELNILRDPSLNVITARDTRTTIR
tara:strand:+ start:2524 stop:6669 length:4146 start_codon:yes stop_codon:yes gene_type:complete